jgi:elongator complex protein 3
MLKIYPTLVVEGTALYQQWKKGEFSPYDTEQAAEVIANSTRFIPPYVRVPRIQRDIPSPLISGGVKNSNLRQIVDEKLKEMGQKCRCIRCREIGNAERKKEKLSKLKLELRRIDYAAGGGKEIFLSFEDEAQDLLAAFLRLRVPGESHRPEIDAHAASPSSYSYQSAPAEKRNPPKTDSPSSSPIPFAYKPYKRGKPDVVSSIVRELHVYGQEAAIGEDAEGKMQHKGLGKKLLAEAQRITQEEAGLGKIAVISGPGVRGYYRKHGYFLDGPYMSKRL